MGQPRRPKHRSVAAERQDDIGIFARHGDIARRKKLRDLPPDPDAGLFSPVGDERHAADFHRASRSAPSMKPCPPDAPARR